jgi:hypothetical protein
MAGGLLQLLAYGAEDLYLTYKPQITFFKVVYRRHTNFSIQTFERTFLDKPQFGKLSKTKIYRLGDLMTRMVLKVILSNVVPNADAKFAWVRRLGHAIIKSIKIEIGGQTIDQQYGEWLDIWLELARNGNHERGYLSNIGDVDSMTKYNNLTKPEYTLFVPLQFWFNKFIGLALPIIAIRYHDIYVSIIYSKLEELIIKSENLVLDPTPNIKEASLLIDYIYLDLYEREQYANNGHEYLIEQVQTIADENVDTSRRRLELQFNYPVKELIWAMRNGNYRSNKRFLAYSNTNDWTDAINSAANTLLNSSILILRGPIYEMDQYGNIIEDQYGNRTIIVPGEQPDLPGTWEEYPPLADTISENGLITVKNLSPTKSLWINKSSLNIGSYNLMDKIGAVIEVLIDGEYIIKSVTTTLDDRDISIPLELFNDTRVNTTDDIIINQFSNYGILITGRYNPLDFAKLEFNDQERFEKRNGKFFGSLMPYVYHNNTPKDGINVYPFALKPEDHQPTGTANFSRIEKQLFTLWYRDSTQTANLPSLNLINKDNTLFIFALGYNVLRIMNGLVVVVYTD